MDDHRPAVKALAAIVAIVVALTPCAWLLLACHSDAPAAPVADGQDASITGAEPAAYTSPEQAAAALACPAGRCRGTRIPRNLGASTPVIPLTWQVAAWYVDSSNTSGCASDTNSGTAAACSGGCSGSACPSGIGPLATYGELTVHRWGVAGDSRLPRLQQSTTITAVSNQLDAGDPLVLRPQMENSAALNVTGTPAAACSGATLSGVVLIQRDAGQLTQATITCDAGGTPAVNELITDSTHAASMWTYKAGDGGAGNFLLTTPLSTAANYTPGNSPSGGSEVAIANGDAVTVQTLPNVDLAEFSPTQTTSGTASGNVSSLSYVTIAGGTAFRDAVDLGGVGPGFAVMNVASTKLLAVDRTWSRSGTVWGNNNLLASAYVPARLSTNVVVGGANSVIVLGGAIQKSNSASIGITLVNTYLDGDVIFDNVSSTNTQCSGCVFSSVYLGANAPMNALGFTKFNTGVLVTGAVQSIWGPGVFDALNGTVIYPSGAFGARSSFLLSGLLEASAQTTNLCTMTLGGTGVGACTTALTPAGLDSALGTTSGCVGFPFAALGSFCNLGF